MVPAVFYVASLKFGQIYWGDGALNLMVPPLETSINTQHSVLHTGLSTVLFKRWRAMNCLTSLNFYNL